MKTETNHGPGGSMLLPVEHEAVAAAIEGKPFKQSAFVRAANKLCRVRELLTSATGNRITRTALRADPRRAMAALDRHQRACTAADREYWRVMLSDGQSEPEGKAPSSDA